MLLISFTQTVHARGGRKLTEGDFRRNHPTTKIGDKFSLIEDLGSTDITWNQKIISYTRTYRMFNAIENHPPHRVIPVFLENGHWGRISRSVGSSFEISSGMRYGGDIKSPRVIIIENTGNYIYLKRYFGALPKTWKQWAEENMKPKDAKQMAKIAINLRKGAKKAALKVFSKMAGKTAGRVAKSAFAQVDPVHFFSTWSGTYPKQY